MTGLLFFILVSGFIIACASGKRCEHEETNMNTNIKNSRKEAKRQAKFKNVYWDCLKDKPVAFITEDGKQVFPNIWIASDVLGIDATTVWLRANNELHYTYEPKDSFEQVKHKFYWVNK